MSLVFRIAAHFSRVPGPPAGGQSLS